MSKTIFKYALKTADIKPDNSIVKHLPNGANVLYATTQRGEIVVYAEVDDPPKGTTPRTFYVHGTGHPINHSIHAEPLGVCHLLEDAVMAHVYVEPANIEDICVCGNPSRRILTVDPPLCGDCGKRFS